MLAKGECFESVQDVEAARAAKEKGLPDREDGISVFKASGRILGRISGDLSFTVIHF